MEVLIEHLGAVQFEVKARNHTLISDQPVENKGFDEGMTPPELFLASLGACAAFYAVDYLERNDVLQEGCRVRVTADKAKAPARLDNFHIEVEVPDSLTADQVKGVDEAVHRCLIHNTLLSPPKMDVEIKVAVPV
jgi:putative redox protein